MEVTLVVRPCWPRRGLSNEMKPSVGAKEESLIMLYSGIETEAPLLPRECYALSLHFLPSLLVHHLHNLSSPNVFTL